MSQRAFAIDWWIRHVLLLEGMRRSFVTNIRMNKVSRSKFFIGSSLNLKKKTCINSSNVYS